jgi:hypothetical protein
MRATPESKQAAEKAGYDLFVKGCRTRQAFFEVQSPYHIPSEAWAFVRGWENAQQALREGRIQ